MGQVPSTLAGAKEVCGSLWNRDINYSGNTTSFVRLDPAGTVLASFTEPGTVEELQQVGDECWAVEHTYAIGTDGFGHDTSYHFIRITLPESTSGAQSSTRVLTLRSSTGVLDADPGGR